MHPFDTLADGEQASTVPAGTWSLDLRRLDLHWSAEAAVLHGLAGTRRPGLARALDLIEPLDRAQLIATVLQGMRRDGVFEADVRMTTPQRTRKLLRVFGHVETDSAGLPLALHGLVEEVGRAGAPGSELAMTQLAGAVAQQLQARLDAIQASPAALGQARRVLGALGRLTLGAPLRREPVDLSALALQVLDELQEREPQRRMQLAVQPGIRIAADPQLAWLLLDILLSNAWKFTAHAPHARIAVDALPSGDAPLVRVQDNGVGFDPQHAGRLFQLFGRLPGAEPFEGDGVGLVLAWHIVQRHGGLVWAHGEPGRGTSVFLRL